MGSGGTRLLWSSGVTLARWVAVAGPAPCLPVFNNGNQATLDRLARIRAVSRPQGHAGPLGVIWSSLTDH